MASLANQTISSTYDGLIKTSTDQPVGASGVQLLEDGVGNSLSLSIGRLNNGITVTGTVTADAFVGDGSGLTGISVSPTLDEVTTNGATTSNSITVGNITATSFIKSGGTSAQFLKADGTVDSNTYLTSFTETNDLTAAVTWANVPDANITESSVTQHEAALSITESQISDLQSYLTAESDTLDSVTGRGASTANSITVGGLSVSGTILDSSGDAGTSGQILSSTATGTNWIDAPTGGGGTIDGSGTGNTISKWLDADTLTDSIITDNGTTATVTGNLSVTGTVLDSDGDAGTSGQILSSTGTGTNWIPAPSGGGGTDYTVQEISTNTTAVKDNLYVFTASLTLTLPASPSVGDKVGIANQSGTNTPVIARNGSLLIGLAEDLTIDVQNIAVEFIYSGATEGWIMFADAIYGAASTVGGAIIDGNGTTNYVTKWVDGNTVTDSVIYDDGTNVGVGTSSPDTLLHLSKNLEPELKFEATDTSVLEGESLGTISWYANDASVGGVGERAFITSKAENLGTYYGLSFGTGTGAAATEKMRIDTNGYLRLFERGIQFGGDTAAANALDDYEEGTWTPTFVPTSGAFASVSYDAITSGKYTKIGNVVIFSGVIRTDAISLGTASGNVGIGGLPFVTASNNLSTGSIGFSSNFAGDTPSIIITAGGLTNLDMYYRTTANGGSLRLEVADLSTGSNDNYIFFNGHYTV